VAGDTELQLTRVANYKSIIWSVYTHVDQTSDLPLLHQFVQYRQKNPPPGSTGSGKRQPNLLALFMAAGGHVLITGQHPVSSVRNRTFRTPRYPLIFLYEIEGEQESAPDIDRPLGDEAFGFKELCLDIMDYSVSGFSRRRHSDLYCDVVDVRSHAPTALRENSMRSGLTLDPNFPQIELRPETAGFNKAHHVSVKGLDVEVYNPQYFFDICQFTASQGRPCFEPIYGLGCLDPAEPTYNQPVAFWTSTFANRVADVPGAVAARSAVFGFPPVYFNPDEIKIGIEYILFVEWQLPRRL
jgi:hypothetical protein